MSDRVRISSAALTDPADHPPNEDAVYRCEVEIPADKLLTHGRLYAVADGTGGQAGGRTASRRALEVISENYYDSPGQDPATDLKTACQTAHTFLYHLAADTPSWHSMSTTFVGAVIRDDQLYVAHVGDSRAYLVHQGKLSQLTEDHIWQEDDEQRGALTRWLGGGERPEVEVDVSLRTLSDGDVIVLGTDGLTNQVGKDEIVELVTRYPSREAAKRVVELAKERWRDEKSSDNVSALVVRYGGRAVEMASILRWALMGGLGAVGVAIIVILATWLSSPRVTPTPTATPIPSPSPVAQTATRGPNVIAVTAEETQPPILTPVVETATPRPGGPTATRVPDTPTHTPSPTLVPTIAPKHTLTVTPPATPCPGNQVWTGQICDCPLNTTWVPDKQWCADAGKGDREQPPPKPTR